MDILQNMKQKSRSCFQLTPYYVFTGKLATETTIMCVCVCSVVSDSLVTPSTVVHQIPLSMESFGKNTIVGSISFSGDLSDPGPSLGIFLTQGLNLHLLWSSELQADSLPTKP